MILIAPARIAVPHGLELSLPGGVRIQAEVEFQKLGDAVAALHLATTQLLTPRIRFLRWGFFPQWVKELRSSLGDFNARLEDCHLQIVELRSDHPDAVNGSRVVRSIPLVLDTPVGV
jgi:hypothetical protein